MPSKKVTTWDSGSERLLGGRISPTSQQLYTSASPRTSPIETSSPSCAETWHGIDASVPPRQQWAEQASTSERWSSAVADWVPQGQ
jgi:hypothetical protein